MSRRLRRPNVAAMAARVQVVTRLAALGAVLAIAGCATGQSGAGALVSPMPDRTRSVIEEIVLRADDVLRAALADLDTGALSSVFRDQALHRLEARVQRMRERGLRMQERQPVRVVLFWDSQAAEAVLLVESQARLITADQPDPPWSAAARQWWARLGDQAGALWVVDERDLAPDQWRPAPVVA